MFDTKLATGHINFHSLRRKKSPDIVPGPLKLDSHQTGSQGEEIETRSAAAAEKHLHKHIGACVFFGHNISSDLNDIPMTFFYSHSVNHEVQFRRT